MSGHYKLEGKNTQTALTMLERVTNILDKNNISYSLKAGTLLGIIRENRLLPWDNDMDLCITEDYYSQLLDSIPELKKLGYMLWSKEFEIDSPPFKKKITRIIKLRTRKLYFIRGEVGLDIFIKFKKDGHYFWQAGQKKYSIPSKFHDELIRYNFNNKKYLIPKDYNGYLTYKYNNWEIPIKIWNPYKDDNAIVGDI